MSEICCCLPIAWLCNCCQRPRRAKDSSYNLLQVISRRDDVADEDDDTSGGANESQGNQKIMRKVFDDKFKEINTILNKKVLKSVMDLG